MNITLTDIMSIISVISILITSFILWNTISKARKEKKDSKQLGVGKDQALSEYEEILKATYELESEREKNTGEHFDESVYLGRANLIRKTTPFFSWIKI